MCQLNSWGKEMFHIAVLEGGVITPLCVSHAQTDLDELADKRGRKGIYTSCGGHVLEKAREQAVFMRGEGKKAIVMAGYCPAHGEVYSRYYPIPKEEVQARWDTSWESDYTND